MLFSIVQIHAGIIPAVFTFLFWSLPAATAMYALTLGVSRIGQTLPGPVYALLSGLNAATVGLIALAAVQLARKAITDRISRILVIFGACAGMCYNALWFFPALLVVGGFVMFAWEMYGRAVIIRLKNRQKRSSSSDANKSQEIDIVLVDRRTGENSRQTDGPHRRVTVSTQQDPTDDKTGEIQATISAAQPLRIDPPVYHVPVKVGIAVIVLFFVAFTVFMSVRGGLHPSPLLLSLFNNMFLAGTIIFGGGPVVIPLLRNYVVDPGWVSPRDFLLGLAIIQAMPGPNFNFAVYLGALVAASNSTVPSIVGAILGYLGIFVPGLWLSVGFQSLWQSLRKRREVSSILRGINATAVGFVFTAVYRLWEIGYLTPDQTEGISLGNEPWWLVVATLTYAAVEWFFAPPPVAILSGGVLGLAWYGAVGRRIHHS
jgi:chromate transport protein ChrA